jgi:hypothetical protein
MGGPNHPSSKSGTAKSSNAGSHGAHASTNKKNGPPIDLRKSLGGLFGGSRPSSKPNSPSVPNSPSLPNIPTTPTTPTSPSNSSSPTQPQQLLNYLLGP